MSKHVELRKEVQPTRFWDLFDAPDLFRWFDGVRPFFGGERMRIEEELTDDTMIVRAELPGIDPDKDVEITLDEGLLRIAAERRSEMTEEKEGHHRSEFRYGSFERIIPVPKDVDIDAVKATYTDGILEVRVPYKVMTAAPVKKVPVTHG